MRIATAAGLTGLALIGLSACNKSSAPPTASSAVAASAAPAATPVAAIHRRDGLWQERMVLTGLAGKPAVITMQVCLDKAVEEKSAMLGSQADRAGCATYRLDRQPNGDLTYLSVCDQGAKGTVTTTALIHGDLDRAYSSDSTRNIAGAADPKENGKQTLTLEATWLHACKPAA